MVGAEAVKIIFLHVGPDTSQAEMMVASARRFGLDCIQLSDEDTPPVKGAALITLPRNEKGIMYFRAKCYAAYNEPGIYLDTDMLIRRDLSPIMDLEFDVGLTRRNHDIIDPNGVNVGQLMPYNGGVVAMKDKTFWPEVERLMAGMDADSQRWYGDQVALSEAAKSRNVLELPLRLYNLTVKKAGLDVSRASILHFKGRGKEVMASYT